MVDGKAHAATDYGVVVFSADAASRGYPSRFVATARSDQDGRFKIGNLPPGCYLAVALDYVQAGEHDRECLESLRRIATPFTLSCGEAKTLDLALRKR